METRKWKKLFIIFFALTLLNKVTEAYDTDEEGLLTSRAGKQVKETNHKCDGLCSENLKKADTQCKKGQGLVPKYLLESEYCKDCECRNDNNCSFTRGFWGGVNKKCQCEAGYEEKSGKCIGTCKKNPCQNNGDCVKDGQDIKCNCKEPFSGTRCEKKIEPTTTHATTMTKKEPSTPAPTTTTEEVSSTSAPTTTTEEVSSTSAPTTTTEEVSSTSAPTTTTEEVSSTSAPTTTTEDVSSTTAPTTAKEEVSSTSAPISKTEEEPSTYSTTNSSTDVNTDTTTNSSTDINTYTTTNLSTDINTYEPTSSSTDVNTDTTANTSTDINTDTTTNSSTDINTDTTINSSTDVNTNTTTKSTISTITLSTTNESEITENVTYSTTTSNEPLNTSETELPPQHSTTETNPGVCKENPCQNGGTCSLTKDGQTKCTCPYPYGGEICDNSHWCSEGMGAELCEPSKCYFDFNTGIGHCRCSKDEFYNYDKKTCQPIDKCPTTPGKCKDNELCLNNNCTCKENYEMNEKNECIPSYCKALKIPCGEGAVCKENERDPENPICVCKEKYVFNGEKCVQMSQCNMPGALKCQQTCYNETCDCKPGYVLQNDGRICELNDTDYKCEKDCKPGICYKDDGNETCICPPTHVPKDGTCKDRCTAGSIPSNLCPNDACEPDADLGFRCKCEGLFTYDQNKVTCRRKLMCSEGNGTEECFTKNARCVEDTKKGFKCECAEAEDMDVDGICKKKCDLKKYKDECLKKLAVCEMDGSKATCKCRPLITSDREGVCTELAISYSGNLPFTKSHYASKSFYASGETQIEPDYEKMRQDLRKSMRVLYGGNYKSADILSCSESSSSFTCAVEIQYYTDPKDQVKLIGDDATCINTGSDSCFIPPRLFLESKSISLDLFTQTDPCMENMKQMNCGGNQTVCNRVPDDSRNFQCSCAKGFVSYNVHYPVADMRTVIHNCEDENECLLPRACPNRTRCFNTYGSYECLCQEGYRPLTDKADTKKYGCASVCDSVYCGNGVCQVNGNSYACRCNTGYAGSYCKEKIADNETSKGAHIALVTLATIVVPLILFGAYMIHRYRMLSKRVQSSSYLDDNSSNLSMQPLRRGLR